MSGDDFGARAMEVGWRAASARADRAERRVEELEQLLTEVCRHVAAVLPDATLTERAAPYRPELEKLVLRAVFEVNRG